MVIIRSLESTLLVSLVPVAAFLIGYSALRFMEKRSTPAGEGAPLSLALALGWGMMSHVLWLMAAVASVVSISLFQRWIGFALVGIAVVLLRGNLGGIGRDVALVREVGREGGGERATCGIGGKIIGGGVLVVIVLLVVRLLLTALMPSFLYDVLEYHLPEARWIVATGSLRPIPGNSYSLMPQGVEILFAFGKVLEGGLTEHAPKLIHLFLGLTAAGLLNAILKEFGAAGWLRGMGIILFLSHPISFKLFVDAYVDFGPAVYGSAAVLCWLRGKRVGGRLYPLLAAIFLGFALSAKYPALGILVLPFLAILAPLNPPLIGPVNLQGRRLLGPGMVWAVLSGMIVVVMYGPWLIRALVTDASLFPPLTLPGPWANVPSQELGLRAFMAQAHGIVSPLQAEYWAAAARRVDAVGMLLLVGTLFFAFWPSAARPVEVLAEAGNRPRLQVDSRLRVLAVFAVAGYLMWNLRTDSADRFLSPLLVVFVAMGVMLVHEMGRFFPRYGRWVALPFVLWAALLVFRQTAYSLEAKWIEAGLGRVSRGEFLERQLGVTARFFEAINRVTRKNPKARVLLLYEARSAAVDAPTISNTVFDPCFLWMLLQTRAGDNPEAMLALLREQGITHIAVNEMELARLVKTYPAPGARKDPAFQAADALPAPGGFQPAFLGFRKCYAPFYYMSDRRIEGLERRLDRFLERVQQDAVWGEYVGGARLLVAAIGG